MSKKPRTSGEFTVRQAAQLSGLNRYMVDYLCRSGTLVPSGGPKCPGRGKKRSYTFGDVVILRGLAQLLKYGVSVYRLREALNELRRSYPAITRKSLPGKYLVTDGKFVYFTKGGSLQNLNARGQQVFAFVLELRNIQKEVIAKEKQHHKGNESPVVRVQRKAR